MTKLKAAWAAIYTNPRVRADALDILKVVAGVIAAKYGLKLA